jgi:protein SCO1/2
VSKLPVKTGLAFLLAAALCITAFIGWKLSRDEVVRAPEEIEDYLFWQAKELTEFKLSGAGGKTLGVRDLKGKWSFLFFGYTHCPDVCPVTLATLGRAFNRLEADPAIAGEIQGIFVSVDPKRDTPELIKEYAAYFNKGFAGVTGSAAELEAFSRQMSALYTVHEKGAGQPDNVYLVTHNSAIFLVDPQARLHARFPPPQDPQEIAEVFLKIRAFYNERSKKRWIIF